MDNTASGAGRMAGIDWTALREQVVRLEALQSHLRDLMDSNLVSRSDESAAATRRYKYLVGPSGVSSVKELVRKEGDLCWRELTSEKQQASLTLSTLTRSLEKLRKKCWLARSEARSNLSPSQY